MKAYALRVLTALDILLNTLLGGNVETVCAGCARRKRKVDRWFCRLLDLLDKNHCEKARQ